MAESKKEEVAQLDEVQKRFVLWVTKINKLKEEVNALSSLQSNPIINAPTLSVGVFLLKMEIIEFELKQIIFTLDSTVHDELVNNKSVISRGTRSPKELEDRTLGKIVGVFCEFESKVIPDQLKTDLKKLNSLRNDFTHNLFDSRKSIEDLKKEACEGINISDHILEYFASLNEFLKKQQ